MAEASRIAIEGRVLFTNDQPIPFVAISNSLDDMVAHSDVDGRYRLEMSAMDDPTNYTFVLSKPAYRPLVTLVTNCPRFALIT